jgi:hypothetical protein
VFEYPILSLTKLLVFTGKLVHIKSIIFIISLLSFSSFANDISEFWAAEPEYVNVVKNNVSQLYNETPDLHVIEFSIKRDPTKIESENEHFIYLKVLDKADITLELDPTVQSWAKSEGIEANEIAVYSAIFKLPKGEFKPYMLSVIQSRTFVNNKWAELVKP